VFTRDWAILTSFPCLYFFSVVLSLVEYARVPNNDGKTAHPLTVK